MASVNPRVDYPDSVASPVPSISTDRSVDDKLLGTRRQIEPSDFTLPSEVPTHDVVQIPRSQYVHLNRVSDQYNSLCRNLIIGGVDNQTIQFLSGNIGQSESTDVLERGSYRQRLNECETHCHFSPTPQTSTNMFQSRVKDYDNDTQHPQYTLSEWAENGPSRAETPSCQDLLPLGIGDSASQTTGLYQPQFSFERHATRSIQLTNLPEGITHAEITSVIRGGQLLDVYLRYKDKTVAISFVHSANAESFYNHVRKTDLYLKHKRVDIRWNDRQYVLPGHIARTISSGATRNLVIRRHDPSISVDDVRDDLEHIHNCIIVKIEIIGSNCFISLNSVSNAMFARSCMMSRRKYKGSRIEWDVDECAQPLDRMVTAERHSFGPVAVKAPKAPLNSMANRFELLSVDC